MKRLTSVFGLVALAAAVANAQVVPKRFAVVTRLGALTPERSASLEPAGLIGLDAEYAINKYFGFGTTVDITRGNSNRKDFVERLKFGNSAVAGGDTIRYQLLGQPVNTLNVELLGTARIPGKRISPFLMAGVGSYTMLLDAQTNGSLKRISGLSYSGGVGVNIAFGEKYGVQLDVRSVQFNNYKRGILDPSSNRLPNLWFPEDLGTPPAAKNTAMSTAITFGFRYIPGGRGN